ncbi:MAG: hypothetical protein FJX74_07905 [Armatimonadetes bacterium]|nr:hypothetical protein [Armatimonadota bacterium]
MIPPFNEHGDLPPGAHESTWAEFEARFGFTARRRELLVSLRCVLDLLQRAGVTGGWVGGSFVTTKPEPGDVDLCWDLHGSVDAERLGAEFWNGDGLAGTADFADLDVMPDDPELGLVRMVLSHTSEGRARGTVLLRLGAHSPGADSDDVCGGSDP